MSVLLPYLTGIAALIVSLGTFLAQRRKFGAEAGRTDAETESITVATALSLLPDMRAEIETLRKRVDSLVARDEEKAKRIDDLEEGVRVLHEQIRQLGHTPIWPEPARRPPSHPGD